MPVVMLNIRSISGSMNSMIPPTKIAPPPASTASNSVSPKTLPAISGASGRSIRLKMMVAAAVPIPVTTDVLNIELRSRISLRVHTMHAMPVIRTAIVPTLSRRAMHTSRP